MGDAQSNPTPKGGISHDFACTHDPCRCNADQIIWWCENHKASASSDGWFAGELRCHVWWWGEAHPNMPLLDPYACRIISGFLREAARRGLEPPEGKVEAAAKGIFGINEAGKWDNILEAGQNHYRRVARAALIAAARWEREA